MTTVEKEVALFVQRWGSREAQPAMRQDLETVLAMVRKDVAGERIQRALDTAIRYGQIDGDHHKTWVIDQVVRALTGEDYDRVIRESCAGEDGPNTYGWDTGIAP